MVPYDKHPTNTRPAFALLIGAAEGGPYTPHNVAGPRIVFEERREPKNKSLSEPQKSFIN